MAEKALLFKDRSSPGAWRVERIDDDGACEVAIFSGPAAREHAVRFAENIYQDYDESELLPMPETKFFDIVFTGPPGSADAACVEVEDDRGRSVEFGHWVKRDDGRFVWRVPRDAARASAGERQSRAPE